MELPIMKSSTLRYIVVLILGVIAGAVITLDMVVQADRETVVKDATPLPLEELRTFTEIYSRIKSDYVESVADKKLLTDAIQGMLTGLDPHSSYLDSDSFKDMRV